MSPEERIRRAFDFLEKTYPAKDDPSPRKIIDFNKLIKYDIDLAEELFIEDVEEVLKAFDMAAERVYNEKTKVRIKNLHTLQSHVSLLREIRADDIGKLVTVECDISVFAPPKSSVESSRWECPSCGNVVTILQTNKEELIRPSGCKCGRKRGFRNISTERIDVQKLSVREPLELIENNVQNPRQMGVLLKEDMCRKDMDDLISAGIRIFLTAVVGLEKPDSPESDFLLKGHYIHFMEEDVSIQFSKEEMKKIKKFKNETENILKTMAKSFAPHISGEMEAKKALILMIVSGDEEKNIESEDTNQINVLFIGSPGSGKSQLGRGVKKVFPKCRYINAQTTTSVGLTASGVKDEFLGGWQIQAGEIVLAHRGVLVIDDFDGMEKEEQDALHEAMSSKTIHKTAGNASAKLKCETNVLAIGNPKYKTWDKMQTIGSQINISKSLLNRFDLIYLFRTRTNFAEVEDGLEKIFNTFRGKEFKEEKKVDNELMKLYLSYAKKLNPTMSRKVLEKCKVFFKRILDKADVKIDSPTITYRQGVSFFKIAKASAKLRLSDIVTEYDALVAYETMYSFMKEIVFDESTGVFDIGIIEGDVKSSRKGKFRRLIDLIKNMEKENEGRAISYDDVVLKAIDEIGLDALECDSYIDSLKKAGEIFFPESGRIKII